MRVSTEGYGMMTWKLRELAEEVDAGVAFVLEGGYSLDPLADGIGMVHEVFDGREPVWPDDDASEGAREVIDAAVDAR